MDTDMKKLIQHKWQEVLEYLEEHKDTEYDFGCPIWNANVPCCLMVSFFHDKDGCGRSSYKGWTGETGEGLESSDVAEIIDFPFSSIGDIHICKIDVDGTKIEKGIVTGQDILDHINLLN